MSTFKANLNDISNLDKNIKIAMVVWNFNSHYTFEMEKQNRELFTKKWFNNVDTFVVPWAFELPGFAKKLIEKNTYELIIVLWVVIRWDTPHFDYVCENAASWTMELNLKYSTPVIFWVLTCENDEQVIARINDWFAISWLNLLSEIQKIK